ncbi:MAG: ThuA domain-containing protein [Armatimonadota bacterium]
MIRVTVWNENRHERTNEHIAAIYPDGIHGAIAAGLTACDHVRVRTATQYDEDFGLGEALLNETDVLVYWAHIAQGEIPDETVARLQQRVLDGMGLIVLHSACISKIFTRLVGMGGMMKWREIGEKSRVWTVLPGHPITDGLPEYFEIPHEEMYGEPLELPAPDELVFISWFAGGEVCRSGCCYQRGQGRVFFFQPGHETYPVYHQPEIQRVIANAVSWAAQVRPQQVVRGHYPTPLEPISKG